MKMENHTFDISWSALWKVFIMVCFVVALFYVRSIVVMLFAAVVVSSAIYEPVQYLEKRGIPRTISVLAIFILGAAIIALVLYAIIPVALIQLQYLLSNLDTLKTPLFDLTGFATTVRQFGTGVTGIIQAVIGSGSAISGIFSQVIGNVFFIVTSIVLSFYLAISKDGVERFLRTILPIRNEEYAIKLYMRTRKKLERWLGGQLTLSLIVGALTFIGLTIIGVEYALVLAVLAAILELVPYVGPIAVGIIAFLVTLPQSFATAMLVVLVFFIIQELENNAIVPLVMSKAVGTDPVTVVVALLAGFELAGFAGVLLAVPTVIIIQEVVDDWSERKRGRVADKS